MLLKDELKAMQVNYAQKPMQDIRLARPDWMRNKDPMAKIYTDKKILLKTGKVVFAHIVQANTILFGLFPHVDCPAHIVYSADPLVTENPQMLSELAYKIYFYKNKPLEDVPEEWRELARVVTDEHDRSDFTIPVQHKGYRIETQMIPVMIFRKLLPKRKLCGRFLPVLISAETEAVMVLPKRYWTKDFRKAWRKGSV